MAPKLPQPIFIETSATGITEVDKNDPQAAESTKPSQSSSPPTQKSNSFPFIWSGRSNSTSSGPNSNTILITGNPVGSPVASEPSSPLSVQSPSPTSLLSSLSERIRPLSGFHNRAKSAGAVVDVGHSGGPVGGVAGPDGGPTPKRRGSGARTRPRTRSRSPVGPTQQQHHHHQAGLGRLRSLPSSPIQSEPSRRGLSLGAVAGERPGLSLAATVPAGTGVRSATCPSPSAGPPKRPNPANSTRSSSGGGTKYGRHTNEWLFRGFSVTDTMKGMLERRNP